jgi:hypothetical protein
LKSFGGNGVKPRTRQQEAIPTGPEVKLMTNKDYTLDQLKKVKTIYPVAAN